MRPCFTLVAATLLLLPSFASAQTNGNNAVVRWEATMGHGYWCSASMSKKDAYRLYQQSKDVRAAGQSSPSVWLEGTPQYEESLRK